MRKSAVAGLFYPADHVALRKMITGFLSAAPDSSPVSAPKALIAPHAGFRYSGPVAAAAFASLKAVAATITRVVLIGPSHHFSFPGIAASSTTAFRTPLGTVHLDTEACHMATALPGVQFMNEVHSPEHCLEVELPFLQTVLGSFKLLPFLTGHTDLDTVSSLLKSLWDGPATLIVVSSDLSHHHDYATAMAIDAETAASIEASDATALSPERACGWLSIAGLLHVARAHQLHPHRLLLQNSGDTAGASDRVVGYGAWAL